MLANINSKLDKPLLEQLEDLYKDANKKFLNDDEFSRHLKKLISENNLTFKEAFILVANRNPLCQTRFAGIFGFMFLHGIGTDPDQFRALNYFETAADFNLRDSFALYRIANFYASHQSVYEGSRKFVRYMQMAATAGHPNAQNWIRKEGLTEDNFNRNHLIYWYKRLAAEGHHRAYGYLGMIYQTGERKDKNFKRALDFFLKAAHKNVAHACLKVAESYQKGVGTDIDNHEAIKWCRKALNDRETKGVAVRALRKIMSSR
ncbi:hypothetical protein G9A89_009185 [Geosiphon pyriformis]|nr:hypothetical protein G9A89_009185 [Geosiphon pyriformis]